MRRQNHALGSQRPFIEQTLIKHNKKSVVMHVAGNAPTTQVFPYTQIRKYPCRNGSIIEIDCNSRQQLISAGRTKALQYTYFWREPLNKTTETVKATVTDLKDVPYTGGEYTSIPDRKTLCVITPYDGIINVIHEGVLIDRRDLHANTPMEINDITWNMEIKVFIGLDLVWKASFHHQDSTKNVVNEKIILNRLTSYSGPEISVPHTLGALASKLSDYPQIKQWLYRCIRSGHMSVQAYRYLQRWIIAGKLE